MKRFAGGVYCLYRSIQLAQSIPAISERDLRQDYNDCERQQNLAGTCHRVRMVGWSLSCCTTAELLIVSEIDRCDMFADLTTKLGDSDMLSVNGVSVESRAIIKHGN